MVRSMNADFPPPGRVGPLERWVPAHGWRRGLILGIGWLVTTISLLFIWIAVAYFRGSTEHDSAAVALNLVLSGFLAIVGLIVMHRATYRWFWHVDRKRAAGELRLGDREPAYGSEQTAPPPHIAWPWTLRLRHSLTYVIGIITVLYLFAPFEHQRAIASFVIKHSAGRSSAGSLSTMLFGLLPLLVTTMLAILLTYRQMHRRDAGLLDAHETLLLEAETIWLFSFGAALAMTMLLCKVAGGMVLAHL